MKESTFDLSLGPYGEGAARYGLVLPIPGKKFSQYINSQKTCRPAVCVKERERGSYMANDGTKERRPPTVKSFSREQSRSADESPRNIVPGSAGKRQAWREPKSAPTVETQDLSIQRHRTVLSKERAPHHLQSRQSSPRTRDS